MTGLLSHQPETMFELSPKSATKSDSTKVSAKVNKDSTPKFKSLGLQSKKAQNRHSISAGKCFSQSTSKQRGGTDHESQSPTNNRAVSYVNSKYKAKGFSKTIAHGLFNFKHERRRERSSFNLTLNSPLLHGSLDTPGKTTQKW